MNIRNYEIAANHEYEIAGGGGFIETVDGRLVAPAVVESSTEAKDIDASPDTRRVVIGYALLFNQIIEHDGRFLVIRPTAFKAVMGGKTKYFQHTHDPVSTVASTKDYLTLHTDEYGLAFKMHIPPTILGMKTRNFLRDNVKQAMSANFTTTKMETHTVDGVDIKVVLEAELHEISLCEVGANSDAFAVLVHDSAEWITDMCKSMRMKDEMDQAHIGRDVRRCKQLLKSLSARMSV
jgi:HK97 family phage prohead protease